MSTEVTVLDPDIFNEAVLSVRNDESPMNWALLGHSEDNPNVIVLEQSGAGGLEEMIEHIMDDKVQYVIVRLSETIDLSTTIKFVYIRWHGVNVPFLKRGKYGVVQGSIEKLLTPYHCCIETDSRDELSEEYVMTKLQEQGGRKNKVLEATVAKTRPERGFTSGTTTKADSTGMSPTQANTMGKVGKMGSCFTGMSGGTKSSGGLNAEDDVIPALQNVHNDSDSTQWCIIGYVDNNAKKLLTVLHTSTEGVEEFSAYFDTEDIAASLVYGLVRVSDRVDEIDTVKFGFVQWVGESVKPMNKAKASTHKGDLDNYFKPYHVSIYATAANEVTASIIIDKVSCASGSKINVKP